MNFELNHPSGNHDWIDPKSLYYGAIYEAEVTFKHPGPKGGTVRRKLDLVAKCHPRKSETSPDLLTASQERLWEAERDNKAHTTVVYDMKCFLRDKGVQQAEDYLSLPLR